MNHNLKILIIITILFLPTFLLGQNISDSLLTTFYNRTLYNYFSDTTIQNDLKGYQTTIIQTEFEAKNLLKQVGDVKFIFISNMSKLPAVLNKPYKKNKFRHIYTISHKLFGLDTIDINISAKTIEYANKQNIYFFSMCGGMTVYIPNARFIYNKSIDKWSYINGQEIIYESYEKEKK